MARSDVDLGTAADGDADLGTLDGFTRLERGVPYILPCPAKRETLLVAHALGIWTLLCASVRE